MPRTSRSTLASLAASNAVVAWLGAWPNGATGLLEVWAQLIAATDLLHGGRPSMHATLADKVFEVWDQPEVFVLELLMWYRDHFTRFHQAGGQLSLYGRQCLVDALRRANTKKRPLNYTHDWCRAVASLLGRIAFACTRDIDDYCRLFRAYCSELREMRAGRQSAYTVLDGRNMWLFFAGCFRHHRDGIGRTAQDSWARLSAERVVFKFAQLDHGRFLKHILKTDELGGRAVTLKGAVGASTVPRAPGRFGNPMAGAAADAASRSHAQTPDPRALRNEAQQARKREKAQLKLRGMEEALRTLSLTPQQLAKIKKKKSKKKGKRNRWRANKKARAVAARAEAARSAPAQPAMPNLVPAVQAAQGSGVPVSVQPAVPVNASAGGKGSVAQARALAMATTTFDVTKPPPRFLGHYIYDFVADWCREFNRQRGQPQAPKGSVCGKELMGKKCAKMRATPPCTRFHGCPICLSPAAHTGGIFGCPEYVRSFPK